MSDPDPHTFSNTVPFIHAELINIVLEQKIFQKVSQYMIKVAGFSLIDYLTPHE